MKILSTAIISTGLALMALPVFAEPVTWWYEIANPDEQRIIDRNIIQPYRAAHPDSDLRIDYRGTELDRQMRIAMLSGSGPDVVFTAGPAYVAPMAQAGQLLSLDGYAEQYGWNERLLPVFLEMGRYDGALYALPTTYETLGLFFNKTVLEDNGWSQPSNIAELESLADAMLAEGIVPFAAGNAAWRGTNEWFVSLVINAVAGTDTVYSALTGETPWTDPAFVESIETLKRWWDKGYFGPNYFSMNGNEEAAAMLASGAAGMMPTGTWQFKNVARYFGESGAEPSFTAFPSAEGAGVFPLGVGSTFSIAATSSQPDKAATVLDFIFTPAIYSSMGTDWQGNWNLPLSDLSEVTMGDTVLPLYTDAMAALATAVNEGNYGYTTWTFLPPATNNYIVNGIEQVWLNQIDAGTFLTEVDKLFQQELAEGKVPATPAR